MYIELKNINKSFGNFKASDDVNISIEKGKLIGLLGPSGSGKTTILRILAGLEKQDSGDVIIDGRNVNSLSAHERGIGFVFQNYALFPYMNVYDNIAYGLKVQKKDKEYITNRVRELLDLVGLSGLEGRYPNELSGGQRQRIALARALAPNPELLLLDEPFAAIDAKVRKELRTWLRETIDKIGITSIFVTHDQDEAIEVADEIVITNNGRVEQVGTPSDIYLNPKTSFVAQFIGQSAYIEDYTVLKGFDSDSSSSKSAIIRPEFIEVNKPIKNKTLEYQSSMEDGVVTAIAFRGNAFEVKADINGIEIIGRYSLNADKLKKGDTVKVLIKKLYTIDGDNTQIITNKVFDVSNVYYI